MSTYKMCSFLPPVNRGDREELLFYCISYALFPRIDRFVKGILEYDNMCPAGGDPGWSLNLVLERRFADIPEDWDACIAQSINPDAGCYEALALSDISGISPEMAYYTVEEVRHYFRLALDNMAEEDPSIAQKVNQIIKRFDL